MEYAYGYNDVHGLNKELLIQLLYTENNLYDSEYEENLYDSEYEEDNDEYEPQSLPELMAIPETKPTHAPDSLSKSTLLSASLSEPVFMPEVKIKPIHASEPKPELTAAPKPKSK